MHYISLHDFGVQIVYAEAIDHDEVCTVLAHIRALFDGFEDPFSVLIDLRAVTAMPPDVEAALMASREQPYAAQVQRCAILYNGTRFRPAAASPQGRGPDEVLGFFDEAADRGARGDALAWVRHSKVF